MSRLILIIAMCLEPGGTVRGGDWERGIPTQEKKYEPTKKMPADYSRSAEVEFYGNFEAAGVIVTPGEKFPFERIVGMECELNVDGNWERMHDAVQVGSARRYATSLFYLSPGSQYQVRVRAIDERGKELGKWYGEGETRPDPEVAKVSRERHVSPEGDDGAEGTAAAPWRTIGKACATVGAGEGVVIHGGVYHEGDLELAKGGKAGAPIVLCNRPGESVVLDGSDPALLEPAGWKQVGERVYSHAYDKVTANACAIERGTGKVVRLFPVPTLQELSERKLQPLEGCKIGGEFSEMGIEGGIHTDGTTATIALPEVIEKYEIRVSMRNRGLILNQKSDVQIVGLEFRQYGAGDYNTAVYLGNSSDVLIRECRFEADNSHVYVKGNSDRVTIEECEFRDAILEWPFGYMKCGGASGQFEGGAVNVDASFSGRGLVFRRNRIEGLFDGVHLTPWRVDEAATNEIDFYQNRIEGCIDDFIEADGFARNVRIFENAMNRSLSGISMAQALDGPTFVVYNVLSNCGVVAAAQREENYGYPFKTNGGSQAEVGSGPMFLYHNTSHTTDPKSRALLVKQAKWKLLTMRNNIWYGEEAGFELWPKEPSPIDWDYDNLFVAKKSAPLVVQAYRKKVQTLRDVQKEFGWLKRGLSAEPGFADSLRGNYELKKKSPCVDAGVALPGINVLRTVGKRPDVGAFEFREMR